MQHMSAGRAARTTAFAVGGALLATVASVYLVLRLERRKRYLDEDHPKLFDDDLPEHLAREIEEERARAAKTSLKRSMYDNVLMLSSDRRPMCTISAKKARWYVKKDLAEWTVLEKGEDGHGDYEDGVRCIRFRYAENAVGGKFGENMSDHLYLRSAKQNVCVGCGDEERHRRHYIVPYSYRALLPMEYKTHMSHDIVILCPDCHLRCEDQTKTRMKELERECRRKRGEGATKIPPTVNAPEQHRIRISAIALIRRERDNLPEEEAGEAERIVRKYLAGQCQDEAKKELLLAGKEELTKSQIQQACSVKCHVKNPAYLSPSEVVVESLINEADVEEFIKGWRRHFVAAVGPLYMPHGWSVDNPVISGKEARRSGKDGVAAW